MLATVQSYSNELSTLLQLTAGITYSEMTYYTSKRESGHSLVNYVLPCNQINNFFQIKNGKV